MTEDTTGGQPTLARIDFNKVPKSWEQEVLLRLDRIIVLLEQRNTPIQQRDTNEQHRKRK